MPVERADLFPGSGREQMQLLVCRGGHDDLARRVKAHRRGIVLVRIVKVEDMRPDFLACRYVVHATARSRSVVTSRAPSGEKSSRTIQPVERHAT